jgi:hypothetical protein
MHNNDLLLAIVDRGTREEFLMEIYLVNPTSDDLMVSQTYGSFDGTGDVFMDLGYSNKGWFALPSQGHQLIDKFTDPGQLDFSTFYNLAVRASDGSLTRCFDQFNGWKMYPDQDRPIVQVPHMNARGIIRRLDRMQK